MSLKNPIKFLEAYTRDDKDIFFGRKKVTSILYEKVSLSKIVLLYGMSGTGKTSLINCGLENRFENNQRTFIYIRRGSNILKSFRQAVDAAAISLIHPDAPLAEALETLYYDYLKSIIIVFDQFEELFISGDSDEWEPFIEEIAGILKSDLHVKIIFSLREEYLAHMDKFEKEIPIIFDHRLRLERMTHETLIDVITGIAKEGGIVLENKDIPVMIIDNISDRKGNVELPYLQVYLDKLTKTGNEKEFTIDKVKTAGRLENVLGTFLDEQINSIAKDEKNKVKLDKNKESIYSILKQLITPDGTKKQLSFDDIKRGELTESQVKDILTKLEDSRILKLDEGIYELSHDSLAKNIAEKRTTEEIKLIEAIKTLKDGYNEFHRSDRKTKLNSNQLKRIQPYLHKMDLSTDEKEFLKKSQWKQKIIQLSIAGLSLLLLGAILYGGYRIQKGEYDKVKKIADGYMIKANWGAAKQDYDNAMQGFIFINKKDTRDSLEKCEKLILREEDYRKWVKLGDSLFDLGVSNYKNAFRYYDSAEKTGFAPTEIADIIKINTDAAITKYREMAESEYKTRPDLAFNLITSAYLLDDEKTSEEKINDWLSGKVKSGDLDRAIGQLKRAKNLDSLTKIRSDALLKKYDDKLSTIK